MENELLTDVAHEPDANYALPSGNHFKTMEVRKHLKCESEQTCVPTEE